MPPPPGLVPPPWWTDEQLGIDRDRAIENFRRARMEEPLEAYLEAFEERQDAFENLLETTVDLTQLSENALAILTEPQLLEALRYVAGPPISFDDLKVVANAPSLSAKKLEANPELVQRLIDTVMLGLDRRRFPLGWRGTRAAGRREACRDPRVGRPHRVAACRYGSPQRRQDRARGDD